MKLSTFGGWASALVSIAAGALTASPDYSYLAKPIAFVSVATFILILLTYSTARLKRRRMFYFGLAIVVIGLILMAVGYVRERNAVEQPLGTIGYPIAWSNGPGGRIEGGDIATVKALQLSATNLAKTEVRVQSMKYISGSTGASMEVKIMADGGWVSVSEVNPIPPNTQFFVEANFGDANGLREPDFLRDWTPLIFEALVDGKIERLTFDRDYFLKIFNMNRPNQGPRVTKRRDQAN